MAAASRVLNDSRAASSNASNDDEKYVDNPYRIIKNPIALRI